MDTYNINLVYDGTVKAHSEQEALDILQGTLGDLDIRDDFDVEIQLAPQQEFKVVIRSVHKVVATTAEDAIVKVRTDLALMNSACSPIKAGDFTVLPIKKS